MPWLSLAFLGMAVVAAILTVAFYFKTGVPSLPTSPKVLAQVLLLVERLPRRHILDLGSGYGTLVLEIARRHPRTKVQGLEISPFPFLISKLRLWWSGLPNANIVYGDVFEADFQGYDLFLAYLTRKPMARLQEKLSTAMPDGAELICHTFALPTWSFSERVQAFDLYHTQVYRYQKPLPSNPGKIRHPWMEPPLPKPPKNSGLLESPKDDLP